MRYTSLLMSLVLIGCTSTNSPPPQEVPSIPVIAVRPEISDVPIYVEAIGTTKTFANVDIRPQVEGMVKEVLVAEGEWIQKGTPLIKIASEQYQVKIEEAKAQIAIDEASLRSAQKKLERFKNLAQKDLIAQTEWEEMETEASKAQATLDMDAAKLAEVELDLQHCTLVSPCQGRVGSVKAYTGLWLSKGQTKSLLSVSQIDPLIVEFYLTEQDVMKLPSNDLNFEIQSLCLSEDGRCSFKGSITFLDHQYDPSTGMLLVRGHVPNPQHTLRAGLNVIVKIPVQVISHAKLIPQKAIRYNPEGPYLYIVQDDKTVVKRPIKLGGEFQDKVIVNEGLEPSDLVVTDGHLRLSDGVKVDVKA